MAKQNDLKNYEKATTTFGKETDFNGTLRFTDSLKIEGKFTGKIDSSGRLFIGEGAIIKADIKTGIIIIGGTVKGNIEASERLEMLPTGRVFGNIKTRKLKISDGVIFDGKCEMIKDVDNKNIFTDNKDHLKNENSENQKTTENVQA